jgi:hypothetical protein
MGEKKTAYRLLVGKMEGKRPLGRPRQRCVNLVEAGWDGVDWIGLTRWVEVASSCEHSNEPSGSIKCWETIEWVHKWWALKQLVRFAWTRLVV